MSDTTQKTQTFLNWFRASVVVVIIIGIGFFVYTNATQENAKYPFKLGLDLAGGSHLVYEADVTKLTQRKFRS